MHMIQLSVEICHHAVATMAMEFKERQISNACQSLRNSMSVKVRRLCLGPEHAHDTYEEMLR